MPKRGKNYREAAAKIEKAKLHEVSEAMGLVVETSKAKFDETIEAHVKLGVDGRHADQQVRGAIVLPNGTGKSVRVLVFAKGPKAEEAEKAGADYVGAEELAQRIQSENWFDFDVVVATPDMMGVVGKLGRVLGPKGLMPNPKSGTVTMDLTKALAEIKAGKVKPVRLSTVSTDRTSSTPLSVRHLSALKSWKKTSELSWTPSSRLSLPPQRDSISEA